MIRLQYPLLIYGNLNVTSLSNWFWVLINTRQIPFLIAKATQDSLWSSEVFSCELKLLTVSSRILLFSKHLTSLRATLLILHFWDSFNIMKFQLLNLLELHYSSIVLIFHVARVVLHVSLIFFIRGDILLESVFFFDGIHVSQWKLSISYRMNTFLPNDWALLSWPEKLPSWQRCSKQRSASRWLQWPPGCTWKHLHPPSNAVTNLFFLENFSPFYRFIWPTDTTITGEATYGQGGSGGNDNEDEIHIPKSFRNCT